MEDSIELREAQPADQALVFALHEALFREEIEAMWGWDREAQLKNFAEEWKTTRIRLIHLSGGVAGYLQQKTEGDHIYVLSIGLVAGQQGRGTGSEVMRILQSEACALGLPVRLPVSRSNPCALRFYESLGFHGTASDTERQHRLEWKPRLAGELPI